MKHISFDPRFVNTAGDDLMPGKIHTIRKNYDWWKPYEGKEVALFTWGGRPYDKNSKHKVFCVKRIVSVQEIKLHALGSEFRWTIDDNGVFIPRLAANDGFINFNDFSEWFANYKPGKMAILHFTDFRYFDIREEKQ